MVAALGILVSSVISTLKKDGLGKLVEWLMARTVFHRHPRRKAHVEVAHSCWFDVNT